MQRRHWSGRPICSPRTASQIRQVFARQLMLISGGAIRAQATDVVTTPWQLAGPSPHNIHARRCQLPFLLAGRAPIWRAGTRKPDSTDKYRCRLLGASPSPFSRTPALAIFSRRAHELSAARARLHEYMPRARDITPDSRRTCMPESQRRLPIAVRYRPRHFRQGRRRSTAATAGGERLRRLRKLLAVAVRPTISARRAPRFGQARASTVCFHTISPTTFLGIKCPRLLLQNASPASPYADASMVLFPSAPSHILRQNNSQFPPLSSLPFSSRSAYENMYRMTYF